jgi:hypothetical protein
MVAQETLLVILVKLVKAANAADNEQAPALIRELPEELRFLLGDQHYRDGELETLCAQTDTALSASDSRRPARWPESVSQSGLRFMTRPRLAG